MTLVIDLPYSHYRPITRPASVPERPTLDWSALALALAVVGLLLANLVVMLGLAGLVNPFWLALVPAGLGLAIALAQFYVEVTWNSVTAPLATSSACC